MVVVVVVVVGPSSSLTIIMVFVAGSVDRTIDNFKIFVTYILAQKAKKNETIYIYIYIYIYILTEIVGSVAY